MIPKLYYHSFKTRWGKMTTATTERGLALIVLPGDKSGRYEEKTRKRFSGYEAGKGGEINLEAERQIKSFLNGDLKKFDLVLDIGGTPFQKKVLKQVAKIPYGKTKTYGEIAYKIGQPGASRAVGSANGSNCLPLVIPCHRVLATNGLGGYGGGLELKEKLLRLEGSL